MPHSVLCVGEVLWDALPAGLFLGGAPFNVAGHLHQLGVDTQFLSRVGRDALGEEIRRRLQRRGISGALLQLDEERPTGFVKVDLDASGSPTFEICAPAAWDAIALDETAKHAACAADAVVFGSLAQRHEPSRGTVRALLDEAQGLKVFDINLRPPFVDPVIIEDGLRRADVVKLNDDELFKLIGWFDLSVNREDQEPTAVSLSEKFDVATVCITRGAHGAALLHKGAWHEHPGYRVDVADAVGAGDAFLARLLFGILNDENPASLLAQANALGAFTASQPGATPTHDTEMIAALTAG